MVAAGVINVDFRANTAQFDLDVQRSKSKFSQFEKSVKRDSRQINTSLGKIQNSVKGMVAGFGKMKVAAAGFAAVLAGSAISRSVKTTLDLADGIGKSADAIGIATDSFQRLNHVAGLYGVNQETMQSALIRFTRRLGQAQRGVSSYTKMFAELGVSLRNADGSFKTVEQALIESADGFNKLDSEAAKASLAADLFTKSGVRMTNMLRQGSDELRKNLEATERLGGVIQEDLIRKAEAANDAMSNLNFQLSGMKNTIILQFAPSIQTAAENLTKLINELKAVKAELSGTGVPSLLNTLGNAIESLSVTMGHSVAMQIKLLKTLKLVPLALSGNGKQLQMEIEAQAAEMTAIVKSYVQDMKDAWKDAPVQNPFTPRDMPAPTNFSDMLEESGGTGGVENQFMGASIAGEPMVGAVTPGNRLSEYFQRLELEANTAQRLHDALRISEERHREVANAIDRENRIRDIKNDLQQDGVRLLKSDIQEMDNLIKKTQDLEIANEKFIENMRKVDQVYSAIFGNMENTLTDFFSTGIMNFEDFANSIIRDINRILVQSMITEPLANALRGGGFNDMVGGLLGMATPKAMGGPVYAGEPYLVGERGPELFMPDVGGRIVPNNQTNINMNINTKDADSFMKSQQQIEERMGIAARRAMARNGRG